MKLPYFQVSLNGYIYYYNINLPQFHKFTKNGKYFFLNCDDLNTFEINELIYYELDKISANLSYLVTESIINELLKKGILKKYPLTSKRSSTHSKGCYNKFKFLECEKLQSIKTIAILVSQRCNLDCIYCYGSGGSFGKKGLMDVTIGEQSIDWLIRNSEDSNKLYVLFFGGEPLINYKLIKHLVDYSELRAKECNKQFRYGITSNATLINREKIGFFKKHNITPLISFDGPKDIHDKNRPFKNGKGSHYLVNKNSKFLGNNIPNICCRVTLTDAKDIFTVKQGITSVGFPYYNYSFAAPSLDGKYFNNKRDNHDLKLLFSFLDDEMILTIESIKSRNYPRNSLRSLLKYLKILITKKKRFFGCGAGKDYVSISIEGDIYYCHRFVNLETMHLGNIYNKYINRSILKAVPVTKLPVCKKCWARFFCGGGCKYINYTSTGDIFLPDDITCQEIKKTVENAIYIYNNLNNSDLEYLKAKVFPRKSNEKLSD